MAADATSEPSTTKTECEPTLVPEGIVTDTAPFAGIADVPVSAVPVALSRCQAKESPVGNAVAVPVRVAGTAVMLVGLRTRPGVGVVADAVATGPRHELSRGVIENVYGVLALNPLALHEVPVTPLQYVTAPLVTSYAVPGS